MTIRNLITLLIILLSISKLTSSVDATQSDGTLRRLKVPILMYHYVSPLPSDADDIRINLTVHPARFREHLQYLKTEGYVAISLHEISQALQFGMPLPEKPIILTFDDGYIDHFTYVNPILNEFGFTGTFFIITSLSDENNTNYMTWQQIQQLATDNMEIAAHTKTHPDLRGQPLESLTYEIIGSYESVATHISDENISFAYPGGKYDENTLKFLKSSSISTAVTTESGVTHTSTSMLELQRIRMTDTTSVYGLHNLINSP